VPLTGTIYLCTVLYYTYVRKDNHFNRGILYTCWARFQVYIIPVAVDCHFSNLMEYNEEVKRLTVRIELWTMKSLLCLAGAFVFVNPKINKIGKTG
jgi:hypothetical protein